MTSGNTSTSPGGEQATERLILHDGSTAAIRKSAPDDRHALQQMLHGLCPASKRLRFLACAEAAPDLLARLSDSSQPRRCMTFVVSRLREDVPALIGVGSYFAIDETTAEVAFAIDDGLHGRGLATLLLERLAAAARCSGFRWFTASVLAENLEMLAVFRDSGFELHTTTGPGFVDIRLSLAPTTRSAEAFAERARVSTIASLAAILRPRAIAVIGASRNPSHLGRRVFDNLRSASMEVYPVNPGAATIGDRQCYASARELPSGVDLAVLAVPRGAVLRAIDDCARAGVKGLVIISAGFAEHDAEGRAMQAQIVQRVQQYGMRMVGPNCMGVLRTAHGASFNASFAPQFPASGSMALFTQSGGIGLDILELASQRGAGLSIFVSLGNNADISGNDLIEYGESDPDTSVILLYLESLGNPGRFGQVARRVSLTKPIVVVKAGRTPAGLRAAMSHTAALAASESIVDGLFRQSGVLRVDTIEEMFDIAILLSKQPLPNGRRVAIITNTGGPGILAADACAGAGLELNDFSEATRAQLAAVLPDIGSVNNPLDMVASADASAYRQALDTLLRADDVDAILANYTTIDRAQTAPILAAIEEAVTGAKQRGDKAKPVVICSMAAARHTEGQSDVHTVPIYSFPEHAARALGRVAAYAQWRVATAAEGPGFSSPHADEAQRLCRDIVAQRGDAWLIPTEVERLLAMFDIRVVPAVVVKSADEAARAAARFGGPVAMKVVSPKVLHKSDVDGVRLHVATDADVRTTFAELSARIGALIGTNIDGMLVQPVVADGLEVLIGVTNDPMFGPLVAFGLGGVSVEAIHDVAFRMAPLSIQDAEALLQEIRGASLLKARRSHPACDGQALRDLLLRVSYMAEQLPELQELDLNPVMAREHGYEIVDARIRLAPASQRQI